MTEEQTQIWNYLTKHSVGVSNSIRIANLAKELGFNPCGTNNDDLRSIIKDMVTNELFPIGTCRDGVFIITTEDEREQAIKWINRDVTSKVTALKNIELYHAI